MKVFPDEEEAKEIMEYDKQVEATKDDEQALEYDLTPEQNAIARKFAHTGTRKKPMIPNLTPRERKPNATKGGLTAELATFIKESSDFDVKNLIIPNKEGKVSFQIGGMWYTWALTEHKRVVPEWIKKALEG